MKTQRDDKLMRLPRSAQYLPPSSHLVLPPPFSRHPFRDSILSTALPNGKTIGDTSKSVPRPFLVIQPSFCRILGPSPSARCLARSPDGKAFAHEAGVWVGASNEVWFTSNLLRHGTGMDVSVEISAVNVDTGAVRLIDLPDIAAANGACPFGERILFCDQGAGPERPSQLVLVDPQDPSRCDVLINNFHGRHFNSLNDVVVLPRLSPYPSCSGSASESSPSLPESTVWFTDPPYGHEQAFRPTPQLPPHVYCWDTATGDVRVVADGLKHPNGIAFSPDQKTCYITDTSHIRGCGTLNPALESTIYAYDILWPSPCEVEAGPSLRNKRVFAFADTGVPDGIKCDNFGNVYSGCGDGLHIWNKYGTLVGKIVLGLADDNIGAGCANFCFVPGGRIVCFAEDRIYIVEGLQVEGDLLAET